MINEFLYESAFFGVFLTIFAYWLAVEICKRAKIPLINPLIISIVIIVVILLSLNIEAKTYTRGASYIIYFMSPATVCLAVPMYRQVKVLKENLSAVIISVLVGAFTSLIIIFCANILFSMAPEVYNAILAKSVTMAVALGISSEINALISVTVICVCISGLTGATILPTLCNFLKISDPISQGLAAGTASHILGTSKAVELGEIQGALSSLAVVVCGVITVCLVPVFVIAPV